MRSNLWIALGAAALLAAPHGVEAQVRTKTSGGVSQAQFQKLQQQVAMLQSQVQALQAVIQVQGSGVRIQANGAIELRSNSGDVRIRAKNVKLEGSVGVEAKAPGSVRIEGGAQTQIKGGAVKLQGNTLVNGKPVTTAGKLVMGTCPPAGGPLIAGKVMP